MVVVSSLFTPLFKVNAFLVGDSADRNEKKDAIQCGKCFLLNKDHYATDRMGYTKHCSCCVTMTTKCWFFHTDAVEKLGFYLKNVIERGEAYIRPSSTPSCFATRCRYIVRMGLKPVQHLLCLIRVTSI